MKAVKKSPTDPSVWPFRWEQRQGRDAACDGRLMSECAALFSAEYGVWGRLGPRPGGQVRMTAARVAGPLDHDDATLAVARLHGDLVGYCAALRFELPGRGPVAWVTQLVVAATYRKVRVATTLLYSVWGFTDCWAWGLVTASPFAVRALETATRRPCRRGTTVGNAAELLPALHERAGYIPDGLADGRGGPRPVVNTEFFIDHDGIPKMRRLAARRDMPWNLGEVNEGEEWVACTFRDQPPDRMSEEALDRLLKGSDDLWVQAYEGMSLTDEHQWQRHTAHEVDHVLGRVALPPGERVLDVGCGNGRHTAELARRGYAATGVDISEGLIKRAMTDHGVAGATFLAADAREPFPGGPYALAVCLYDVVGSTGRDEDDLALLGQIREALRPGGALVLSTMNEDSVLPGMTSDHLPSSVDEFVRALEALPPSSTMQSTGDIFDPRLLLRFNGVFYRKEQFFPQAGGLPHELVVRDRRQTADGLSDLLVRAGFQVESVTPVQSGRWDRTPPLGHDDPRAKEFLLTATKGS